jgi:hypothetical protein
MKSHSQQTTIFGIVFWILFWRRSALLIASDGWMPYGCALAGHSRLSLPFS